MSCRTTLSWYELIPVFSFIGLRGRCKTCQTGISVQYPLVESVTGIIFALLFLKFQDIFFLDTLAFTVNYAYYAVIFCLLIVIAAYDLKHKIIPDTLSLVLGVISFIGIFFISPSGFYLHMPGYWELFSGVLVALPFAFLWLGSRGTLIGLRDAPPPFCFWFFCGWCLGVPGWVSGMPSSLWAWGGFWGSHVRSLEWW